MLFVKISDIITSVMKLEEWITTSTKLLRNAGVSTPRLDAEILASHVLQSTRAQMLTHTERRLSIAQVKDLHSLLERRLSHEPISYITGKSEFFGRSFEVSSDTLQPRPETETMIELALKQHIPERSVIVDVGTGSGSIIITLSQELTGRHSFYATDISSSCISIASRNATAYSADITFIEGDLLSPINKIVNKQSSCLILANLPYVPNHYVINEAARHEPDIAIYGGKDGLDLYRKLFDQLDTITGPDSVTLLTESLPPQHSDLAQLANSHGFELLETQDFIQVFTRRHS